MFGFRSGPLGDWVAEHRLLPTVADAVLPYLTDPALNGVKFFFGGREGDEVAEVRVNGEPVAAASAALRALPWPRGERLAWVRCFVLLAADPQGPTGAERTGVSRTAQRAAPGTALLRRWLQQR